MEEVKAKRKGVEDGDGTEQYNKDEEAGEEMKKMNERKEEENMPRRSSRRLW